MIVPRPNALFDRISGVREERRRAAYFQSGRMYEELNEWQTVDTSSLFSFTANWSHAGAGYGDTQLLIDPMGLIHMRGAALCANGGGGDILTMANPYGPTGSGGVTRFPVFITIASGPGAGNSAPFYVYVSDDEIVSPGTAGFGLGADFTSTYRVEFGGTTWRRLV